MKIEGKKYGKNSNASDSDKLEMIIQNAMTDMHPKRTRYKIE